MKLKRARIENVRSFLAPAELLLDGDISIIIGPNGGGKTNLLDTITTFLRMHLLVSWGARHSPIPGNQDRYEVIHNDMIDANLLERHSQGAGKPQLIELELEITEQDIANMKAIQTEADKLGDIAELRYANAGIRRARDWDLNGVEPGRRCTYKFSDNNLIGTDAVEKTFKEYLNLYEEAQKILAESGGEALSMPMLSLPVNRGASGFQSNVSLANYNEFEQKRTADAATSKRPASLAPFAVGRLAEKYRLLLEEDSGNASDRFYADPQIKKLSSILEGLGYTWKLVTVNPIKNEYDVQLTKQGTSFLVSAASSGEKELLTYLFGIYALNVRNALIIVDEPELHLHPIWQETLFSLFERLTKETGNQFLLATHSPVFVSPASIQYVSRVHSVSQQSVITRLSSTDLPEPKHLFAIINSQNNESIFFTNKVILVEGVSDKLFFEAILRKLSVKPDLIADYEIVNVNGKGFFPAYKKVLKACGINYAVIADLDYVCQKGDEALKSLFAINNSAIEKDIVDPASRDAESLFARIDGVIAGGSLDDLRLLWEYIKGRRRKLRGDLSMEDQEVLDAFIVRQRVENTIILSRGDLEEYLPVGCRSKDMDKLIRFLAEPDFWDQLSDFAQLELTEIAKHIETM